MAEDISQIFQNANSKFDEQNYKQAEELFTKYITSCLQSRYFCTFLSVRKDTSVTLVTFEVLPVKLKVLQNTCFFSTEIVKPINWPLRIITEDK